MGYEWLPGLMAILHGAEPVEVLQALDNPRRWPRRMVDQHGNVFVAIWSRTATDRPIIVVVRPRPGLDATIVAARPMTPAETAHLEQWEHDQ
ncbi:hypothetical protein [Dactylosporangium darangshiense]|uniref:Uncharacterized protein n=1 Tax=Dactylosporangium darangshiense TaxID=579108 RepID=A0ABP8DH63_9ACTN